MAGQDSYYKLLSSAVDALEDALWGEESKKMGIAERVMEWTREWKEEGRLEGLQEVVLSLLEQRFGTVAEDTRSRVLAIRDVDELKKIAKGILLARSLRDLGLD